MITALSSNSEMFDEARYSFLNDVRDDADLRSLLKQVGAASVIYMNHFYDGVADGLEHAATVAQRFNADLKTAVESFWQGEGTAVYEGDFDSDAWPCFREAHGSKGTLYL